MAALGELAAPITTTYQLMGKFLSLKEHGVESIEHADRFYYWLKASKTAAGQRSGVVRAIAEKLNVFFHGLYDSDLYGDLRDDDDAAVAKNIWDCRNS